MNYATTMNVQADLPVRGECSLTKPIPIIQRGMRDWKQVSITCPKPVLLFRRIHSTYNEIRYFPLYIASPKIDMVFVMDRSGSIRAHNFVLEKKFVERLIEYFAIFPAKTRVAIVTYSTTVKLEFNFNKHINKECLRKGIQGIRYVQRSYERRSGGGGGDRPRRYHVGV